jgi:hypothetical protein
VLAFAWLVARSVRAERAGALHAKGRRLTGLRSGT